MLWSDTAHVRAGKKSSADCPVCASGGKHDRVEPRMQELRLTALATKRVRKRRGPPHVPGSEGAAARTDVDEDDGAGNRPRSPRERRVAKQPSDQLPSEGVAPNASLPSSSASNDAVEPPGPIVASGAPTLLVSMYNALIGNKHAVAGLLIPTPG